MIRVDSHFHPNFAFFLPEALIRRHARKIWETFKKRRLDVVFVSEHAFKSPRRSFETLEKYRPKNARTLLVPAIEVLTKEGVDMIVFSKDRTVFTRKELLTPYRLTIEQVVAYVRKDPRLFGAVVHPYAPSKSAIMNHRSARETMTDMRKLGFAEEFNTSLVPLRHTLSNFRLTRLLKRFVLRLNRTIRLPATLTPQGIIALGGSDAHHAWDIGSCLLVRAPRARGYADAFRKITSPRYKRSFWYEPEHIPPLLSIAIDGITAFREHFMRVLHLYRVDAPLTLSEA
jgi:hypothetical protein